MDLTEIEAEYEKDKIYSMLSTAWAVIADIDINSETIRWMGFARMTLWGIFRVVFKKLYRGHLWYRGMKVKSKQEGLQLKEGLNEFEENRLFTPELPEFNEPISDHSKIEN